MARTKSAKQSAKKAGGARKTAKAAGAKRPPAADAEKSRARSIYRKLRKTYPRAKCALEHRDPYELLVATILSAQCTDDRVNKTTPALFEKYPTARKLAASEQEDVERLIRSCGFYRQKAKAIRAAAQDITRKHGGRVPDSMQELTALHGVARKTANVVLGTAYGVHEGIVVDTHVRRLANRMGLTTHSDPDKIERDLMALFPRANWDMAAHLLIWHGRRICTARKPDCPNCPVNDDCPKIGVKT